MEKNKSEVDFYLLFNFVVNQQNTTGGRKELTETYISLE